LFLQEAIEKFKEDVKVSELQVKAKKKNRGGKGKSTLLSASSPADIPEPVFQRQSLLVKEFSDKVGSLVILPNPDRDLRQSVSPSKYR